MVALWAEETAASTAKSSAAWTDRCWVDPWVALKEGQTVVELVVFEAAAMADQREPPPVVSTVEMSETSKAAWSGYGTVEHSGCR